MRRDSYNDKDVDTLCDTILITLLHITCDTLFITNTVLLVLTLKYLQSMIILSHNYNYYHYLINDTNKFRYARSISNRLLLVNTLLA